MKLALPAALMSVLCLAPLFAGAQSERRTTPGNGPDDMPQSTFLGHQLGSDHAEAITTLDMNGDGRMDLLSGGLLVRESRPNRWHVEAASIPHRWHPE